MRNKITFLIATLLLSVNLYAQSIIESTLSQVTSPDGKYVFNVYQRQTGAESKQLYYTLSYDNKTIIYKSNRR